MTEFKSSGTRMGENGSGELMNKSWSSKVSISKDARACRRRKLELSRAKYVGEDSKVRKMQMFSSGEQVEKAEVRNLLAEERESVVLDDCPKFGHSSICGRRRDMEDFVAIQPWFCNKDKPDSWEFHYFGVYDGHGCSHVRSNTNSFYS